MLTNKDRWKKENDVSLNPSVRGAMIKGVKM